MSLAHLIYDILIKLVMVIVGIALAPLLKKLWERINRPSPLNPQTKGQYVTALATYEHYLDQLNYLNAHPKDLFLNLIQIILAALLLLTLAGILLVFKPLMATAPYADPLFLTILLVLIMAAVFCISGLFQAGRMSDKKIEITRASIQKRIDEFNKKLNPAPVDTTNP